MNVLQHHGTFTRFIEDPMYRVVTLAITAFAIAGCTVTPPSVRVASPAPIVVVEPAPVVVSPGHGGHCPPGQAKKGRC